MALWILRDPRYRHDYWETSAMVNERIRILNRKKIDVKLLDDTGNLTELFADPEAAVFIEYDFFYDLKGILSSFIHECNLRNIPVISAHSPQQDLPGCFYSSIASDTAMTMRIIDTYFSNNNRHHVAYFGVNLESSIDKIKASYFFAINHAIHEDDIYYKLSSVAECFETFYERHKSYDAVICVNDFVAIYFMEEMRKRDPSYLAKTFIISFKDTLLARLYPHSLTSCSYSPEDVTTAIYTIYREFIKHRDIFLSHSINLVDRISVRDSTQNQPLPIAAVGPHSDTDYLFNHRTLFFPPLPVTENVPHDNSIDHLLRIETMLNSLDLIDLQILYLFLIGMKNTSICNSLFVSFKTIQYRSKRMFLKLNTKSKREFVEFLTPYIQPEHLKTYIESLEKNHHPKPAKQ